MEIGQVEGLGPMFATRQANAATGHVGPWTALWCTTAPLVPFFVLAMEIVALFAVRRVVRPE